MAHELRLPLLLGLLYLVLVLAAPWRQYRRPLGLLGVAVFLIVVPFFMPKFQNDTFTDYAVFAMAAISLNMLVGMSGEVSLGHGALLAIGGYAAAILMHQNHVSFYVAVLVAALVAAAIGLLLGLPAVRLTGPYLAIATLGLAIAIPPVFKWVKVTRWTGGAQGVTLIGNKSLPHVPSWLHTLPGGHIFTFDEFQYFLTLFVALLMGLIVWNFHRSRTGRAVLAQRDSEPAAKVVGIDVARYKVLVFMLSALIAGVSGAFLVLRLQSVAPDTYGLDLSIQILAMVVIGGLDSILGSVVGAIFIRWLLLNKTSLPAPTDIPSLGSHLPHVFANLPVYGAGVYYGLALVLVMILMPYGIAGAFYRLINYPYRDRWLRSHEQPPAVADAAENEGRLHPPDAPGARNEPKEVTPR